MLKISFDNLVGINTKSHLSLQVYILPNFFDRIHQKLKLLQVDSDLSLKMMAAEKVKHAVNNLTETQKVALSYAKEEFITKCSFNGRACSVEE